MEAEHHQLDIQSLKNQTMLRKISFPSLVVFRPNLLPHSLPSLICSIPGALLFELTTAVINVGWSRLGQDRELLFLQQQVLHQLRPR